MILPLRIAPVSLSVPVFQPGLARVLIPEADTLLHGTPLFQLRYPRRSTSLPGRPPLISHFHASLQGFQVLALHLQAKTRRRISPPDYQSWGRS